MIFSIRNLGFELGSLLLEGWAAFAARVVCAALLLALGWLARQLLSRRVFPALLRRNWRLAVRPFCCAALPYRCSGHPCSVHLCRSGQPCRGQLPA